MSSNQILADDEAKALIMSFARGRGEKGIMEPETQKLLDWAEITRIQASMLDLIISGEVIVADIEASGSPKVIAAPA